MTSAIPARIGRYEIVGRLGAGGMGVVYLGQDPLLRRTVAIKVLPRDDDSELRDRFLREARSVAALRHPNIVTIYDIGEEQGRLFIAMERIEGESMADTIGRATDISIERKLQLMIELCAALGYAHRNGIIHRDIKPGNLMICSDGTLKVLDFGLARLAVAGAETALTRSGELVGTPNYMSPEQIKGEPLDQRSDIFSVGLVMYEWLSYRRAYNSESIHTLLHDIIYNDPPPLRTRMPAIDPALDAAVEKALKKDPALRYQTLDVLEADLRGALEQSRNAPADQTVLDHTRTTVAIPPSALVTTRAMPRAAIGAAIAATLLIAISVFFWQKGTAPASNAAQQNPPTVVSPAPVTIPEAPAQMPAAQAPTPAAAPDAVTATAQQVTVDMLPWARVRIFPVGHQAKVPEQSLLTPFTIALAPGNYRLECENDGISPRTILPITVVADRPLTISRKMNGFNAAKLVDTLLGPRQ